MSPNRSQIYANKLEYKPSEITRLSFDLHNVLLKLQKQGISVHIHTNAPLNTGERLIKLDIIYQSQISTSTYIISIDGSVVHKPSYYDFPPNPIVIAAIKDLLLDHFSHPVQRVYKRTNLIKHELMKKTFEQQMNLNP